jgi:hypothetical protein
MLDSGVQHMTIDDAWSESGCRVALPEDLADVHGQRGAGPGGVL